MLTAYVLEKKLNMLVMSACFTMCLICTVLCITLQDEGSGKLPSQILIHNYVPTVGLCCELLQTDEKPFNIVIHAT